MEDFVYVPSPIFYWTVRKYLTLGESLSPTFTLFGFKWRLKFTRFIDAEYSKARIDLESLSGSKRVEYLIWGCEIKFHDVFTFYDGRMFDVDPSLGQVTNVRLQNKICCLWSDLTAKISPYSKSDITISIKLIPSRGSNKQFLLEEHKKQETLEKIPWMTSLLKDFESLYNNKDHSDYELKCGELSLAVHKAILSVRCSYFAALFRSPMKESLKEFVEFQNIEPSALEHVIGYFYTGTLPEMSLDIVHKVYSVADMFLCEPLKTKCVSLMIDDFNKKDKTVSEDKKEENPSGDSEDCKKLLNQLFLTREWQVFYDGYPDLAHEIFKPILFGTVKI